MQLVGGKELGADADFADPPGNELTVLRPKVEDDDGLVSAGCGNILANARRV